MLNSDGPTPSDIARLGPWYHNLVLDGIQTAPNHFLGDYPRSFFQHFADAIPRDLRGWSVLDVGCNAGFYSFEMARRGADRVIGIDSDPTYLAQARFAADRFGLDVEFRHLSVYDVGQLAERFDLVLFLGVLYHLRHPLLALDLLRNHAVGRLLVFQSMQRGSPDDFEPEPDYPFTEVTLFENPAFPRMYFIEHRYANDPTNWWVPTRSAAAAMLRSAGFVIRAHPDPEVFVCEPDPASAPHPLPGLFGRPQRRAAR